MSDQTDKYLVPLRKGLCDLGQISRYFLVLFIRKMLAYVYIREIQKELDVFLVSVWNAHRIRKQKEKELPLGVPEHIHTCPERHGGEKCGFPVTEEQLREVAELANILDGTDDFLPEDFRQECQRHLPNTADIEPDQAPNAFLYLKSRLSM